MITKFNPASDLNLHLEKDSKVVFTNGCFDIIHVGHVTYLEKAARLGDFLIVGLNSDVSVKKLDKGVGRPINDENARAKVLSAIKGVAQVIIFEEETPEDLIKAISPDILVKGGDWEVEKIVGSEHVIANGGEVKSIPFVEGYSTSEIESKIIQSHDSQ